MPALIGYLSSPLLLLASLFVLTFLCHFVFSRCLNLDESGYKRLDYYWLFIAVLGLVPHAAEVRKEWFSIEAHYLRAYPERVEESLIDRIEFGSSFAFCREFTRTEFSPVNLERLQAEYDAACADFKSLAKLVGSLSNNELIGSVQDWLKTNTSKYSDQQILSQFESVANQVNDLERAMLKFESISRKSKSYWYETILLVFSPLLLVIAFAIRVAKVAGEIRLKR